MKANLGVKRLVLFKVDSGKFKVFGSFGDPFFYYFWRNGRYLG
jgi:hypothetical protein